MTTIADALRAPDGTKFGRLGPVTLRKVITEFGTKYGPATRVSWVDATGSIDGVIWKQASGLLTEGASAILPAAKVNHGEYEGKPQVEIQVQGEAIEWQGASPAPAQGSPPPSPADPARSAPPPAGGSGWMTEGEYFTWYWTAWDRVERSEPIQRAIQRGEPVARTIAAIVTGVWMSRPPQEQNIRLDLAVRRPDPVSAPGKDEGDGIPF